MSARETSNPIDGQLRNVAVPPELLPRLREIAAMGDAELDHVLRTAPVPQGMLDRLQAIGSLSDSDLDGELRDVELPLGMQQRMQRSMRWQTQRAQIIGWAVAASLLAIVSGIVYLAGSERNVGPQANPPRLAQSNGSELHSAFAADRSTAGSNAVKSGAVNSGPQPRADVQSQSSNIASAEAIDRSSPPKRMDKSSVAPPSDSHALAQDPLATEAISDAIDLTDPLPADAASRQDSVFGGDVHPGAAKLKLVQAPEPRGVMGPAVEGYDLVSELRWGRHPFVAPGVRPALRESRAPVWLDTSSYEMTCRMVAAGQLPPPAQVRTEDFLAGMDYGFPPPSDGPLGIRTAAGPAPWGPPGMSLLQIGIQAASLPVDSDDSVHLTLVIDASAAMRDSGRSDLVRRALLHLIEEMRPGDRVSIVAFNDRSDVLLRDADQAELRRVVSAWNDAAWNGTDFSGNTAGNESQQNLSASSSSRNYLRLDGAADMAAGLQMGLGLIGSTAAEKNAAVDNAAVKNAAVDNAAVKTSANKMVLIADSLDPIDDRSLPRLLDSLHHAVDAGMKWEMIGLSHDAASSSQWDELAQIGGHAVQHAGSPGELFERLNETRLGRSQVVAASVEMKLVFDPAAVSRYRLIGHELNSGGGFSPAPLQQDLRSGQAATALYEVELKPDGPTDVAFVEVSWRDPVSDASRHIRQPISRLQFLATWRECALPLQTAAVAAETAEVLRSSIMLPPSARVLDQVAELAADMNSALVNRPSVVRLKQLINQARNAKPFHATTIRIGS